MQFNTAYLGDLARYGITANDVAAAGCYSFDLAAWRLRMHIRNDKGDLWTKAANYHSRTPQYNAVYRADLMRKASKWADWLEARFVTLDVTKAGATPSTPSQPAPAAHVAQRPGRPSTAAAPQRPQQLAACRWPATCPARCLSTLHARVGRVGRLFRFSG
jgi:hypothetical protein